MTVLGVMVGWWANGPLPRLVDKALDNDDMAGYRGRVCAGLSGEVLELGFGSGLNVAHYPAAVTRVLAVEPSDGAWRLAGPRMASRPVRFERAGLDGQRLDLADASVDHVLSTMTLCTIPDLSAALSEVGRVLRPGGCFHFLEHGLAPEIEVERWQRRIEPLQRRLLGGCHLTRAIDESVRAAGFEVSELATFYGPGPARMRPFGFHYLGRAFPAQVAGAAGAAGSD